MLGFLVLLFSVQLINTEVINDGKCGKNKFLDLEDPQISTRIAGGQISDGLKTWPWACSFGDGFEKGNTWNHNCGATLITPKHALTAAHCVTKFLWGSEEAKKKIWEKKIRCGDFNLKNDTDNDEVQIQSFNDFKIHEKYELNYAHFDIAILYIQTPFIVNQFVRTICLQSPMPIEKEGTVIVVGWGLDEHSEHGNELKQTTMQMLTPQICDNTVSKLQIKSRFGQDLFCAIDPLYERSGTLPGDSGGPLFTLNFSAKRYELRGIVNGGLVGEPDYNTRTSFPEIHNWIVKHIKGEKR